MELELIRTKSTPESLEGKLAINGVFECYTLERPYVDSEFKPIPEGVYEVQVFMSPKFKEMIPHILNVPGREAIEIHMGNHVLDTHGCVLVGRQLGENEIYSSFIALSTLIDKLGKATDKINITIRGVLNENKSMVV